MVHQVCNIREEWEKVIWKVEWEEVKWNTGNEDNLEIKIWEMMLHQHLNNSKCKGWWWCLEECQTSIKYKKQKNLKLFKLELQITEILKSDRIY
jgi:hypothetical protein